MSLSSISGTTGLSIWPNRIVLPGGSESTRTLDALNEYVTLVFTAPVTATISKIVFVLRASNLVGTLSCGFYGVASNGYGNTSAYGGMADGTVTDPAAGVNTVTLGTACSFTAGDLVSCRIKVTSYTSGSCTIPYRYLEFGSPPFILPRHHTDVSTLLGAIPYIYFLTDSDVAVRVTPMFGPWSTSTTASFASNSTPDELGNKFTIPFDMRACGFVVCFPSSTLPTSTYTHYLRDSDGNTLASASPDHSDYGSSSYYPAIVYFTPVELSANDVVYGSIAGGGTSNKDWAYLTFDSTTFRDFAVGETIRVERTDAGAWTEYNTTFYLMHLLYDQADFGGSSVSGMVVHPGMSGGMRG